MERDLAVATEYPVPLLSSPMKEVLPQGEVRLAPQIAFAECYEDDNLFDVVRAEVRWLNRVKRKESPEELGRRESKSPLQLACEDYELSIPRGRR